MIHWLCYLPWVGLAFLSYWYHQCPKSTASSIPVCPWLYLVSIYFNLCFCHCLFPAYLWVTASPFIFCPNVTLSLLLSTKIKIISMVTGSYCREYPYLSELCPLDFLDQFIVVVMFWKMFKSLHHIIIHKLRWTISMHKPSHYNSCTAPLFRAIISRKHEWLLLACDWWEGSWWITHLCPETSLFFGGGEQKVLVSNRKCPHNI